MDAGGETEGVVVGLAMGEVEIGVLIGEEGCAVEWRFLLFRISLD